MLALTAQTLEMFRADQEYSRGALDDFLRSSTAEEVVELTHTFNGNADECIRYLVWAVGRGLI